MEEAKVRRQETQSDKNKNKARICRNTTCGGQPDLTHTVAQSFICPQCSRPVTEDKRVGNPRESYEDFQLVTPLPLLSIIPFCTLLSPHLPAIKIITTHKYSPCSPLLFLYHISWRNTNLISIILIVHRCHFPWEDVNKYPFTSERTQVTRVQPKELLHPSLDW